MHTVKVDIDRPVGVGHGGIVGTLGAAQRDVGECVQVGAIHMVGVAPSGWLQERESMFEAEYTQSDFT